MVLTFRHSSPLRPSLPDPDPSDVDRIARKAAVHAGRGETAQAMAAYQLALLMDEGRADLWFNYGSLQRRLGMTADAVLSFEFALRQDPGMYAARYSLARLLCDLGHPLEALAHFRQVTQERPGYTSAWRYLVQLTWALGDRAAAQGCAIDALRLAPGDAELAALLRGIAADNDPPAGD